MFGPPLKTQHNKQNTHPNKANQPIGRGHPLVSRPFPLEAVFPKRNPPPSPPAPPARRGASRRSFPESLTSAGFGLHHDDFAARCVELHRRFDPLPEPRLCEFFPGRANAELRDEAFRGGGRWGRGGDGLVGFGWAFLRVCANHKWLCLF